jgi:type II secretory pathway pseudopilin PulG
MKALFIFAVILILLALTAVRFRKQISAAITVGRMIRDAGQGARQIQQTRREPMAAAPLVRCARCGTWVPENRVKRLRTGDLYCSDECLRSGARAA